MSVLIDLVAGFIAMKDSKLFAKIFFGAAFLCFFVCALIYVVFGLNNLLP
jgi:hypothetical protein